MGWEKAGARSDALKSYARALGWKLKTLPHNVFVIGLIVAVMVEARAWVFRRP